jgi:hypothetical protein
MSPSESGGEASDPQGTSALGSRLDQLRDLNQKGILTNAEYEAAVARAVASGAADQIVSSEPVPGQPEAIAPSDAGREEDPKSRFVSRAATAMLTITALVVGGFLGALAWESVSNASDADRSQEHGDAACQLFTNAVTNYQSGDTTGGGGTLPAPNADRVIASEIWIAYDSAHAAGPGRLLGALDELVLYNIIAAWDQDPDAIQQGAEKRIQLMAEVLDICESGNYF